MDEMVIIVEGKNDKLKLRKLLSDQIIILCTYGTLGTEQLFQLHQRISDLPVMIFTDNDASGKRIRYILRESFPDAEHLYTRREYAGVEGTPDEYLIQQLEKAELNEYIIYPDLTTRSLNI